MLSFTSHTFQGPLHNAWHRRDLARFGQSFRNEQWVNQLLNSQVSFTYQAAQFFVLPCAPQAHSREIAHDYAPSYQAARATTRALTDRFLGEVALERARVRRAYLPPRQDPIKAPTPLPPLRTDERGSKKPTHERTTRVPTVQRSQVRPDMRFSPFFQS